MLLELLSLRCFITNVLDRALVDTHEVRVLCRVSRPATVCALVSVHHDAVVSELVFCNTMNCGTCTYTHTTRALLFLCPGLLAGRAAQTVAAGLSKFLPVIPRRPPRRKGRIRRGRDYKGERDAGIGSSSDPADAVSCKTSSHGNN